MNDITISDSPPPESIAVSPRITAAERRFSDLVDTTHQRLLAYAVRRTDVPADAADIVAETYLVAWRRIEDIPEGEAAIGWLFGTARRVLANHHRGQRRRLALTDRLRDSLTDITPAPAAPSPVLRALTLLRPDDQELLRLDAWEELTIEQIAAALCISRGAARVRLHRARRRLAAALDSLPPARPAASRTERP